MTDHALTAVAADSLATLPEAGAETGAASAAPRRGSPELLAGGAHLPVLDGVRGLAILMVMLYHQTLLPGDNRIDRIFLRLAGFGWCGVDLFFVLSGFLITGILLDAKGSSHYLRNFYARRVLRIFPLYYGILIFSVVLLPLVSHPKSANFARISGEEVWYFFYLQNYVIAWHGTFRHAILDVTWSLAIEEQFYLVWPFVVLLLRPRTVMRLCLAILLVSPVLRLVAHACGASEIAIYVTTPLRMDGLAAGAFAAVAIRQEGGIGRLLRGCRWVAGAAAAGLVVLGVWLFTAGYSWVSPVNAVGYSFLAALFTATLLLAVGAGPGALWVRALAHPALRSLGKYSYAMYLFHMPLRALIRDTLYNSDNFLTIAGSRLPGQLLFYLAATALTFLAAWLSWHLYERQFLKLKRFFPREG